MLAPLSRIVLRYVSGALVVNAMLNPTMGNMIANDPDIAKVIELGLGLALAGVVEGWYGLARARGWSK